MANSKKCFKCNQEKPLEGFYQHPAMADGHLGKCKECAKQDALQNRAKNIEKVRAYDRQRAKLPERAKKAVKWHQLWRKEDKRRSFCHQEVAKAIRHGFLVPLPCEKCGREDTHAHHEDYDKPLEVVWLCPPCHFKRHKELLSTIPF